MLLHYQWSSANNARNLPAFGEYSFGFVRPIRRAATLSVVATNLTNTYAGAFASPLHAVGLPTTSGALFPTLASPLRPAVLFVQFTFKQQPVPDPI
jgi:hypothetical protein